MGLALVHGRARVGVAAPPVQVEVHLGGGLPSMSIVGLPEAAVREAKDRVRAAIQCAQFEFPARRITVNLAPADLPKHGGRFDLPIALGILAASGQVPAQSLDEYECLGELALSGAVRPVQGVLPAALAARAAGRTLMVPHANAEEASLASGLKVIAVEHLLQIAAHHGARRQHQCQPVRPGIARGIALAALDSDDLEQYLASRAATAPAAANFGAKALLVSPPAENSAMSTPAGSKVARSCTTMSS